MKVKVPLPDELAVAVCIDCSRQLRVTTQCFNRQADVYCTVLFVFSCHEVLNVYVMYCNWVICVFMTCNGERIFRVF